MVSLLIATKGKPTISVDFPNKHPDKVTIKDVKTAVHAKFPKVGDRQVDV
jgi:very-long-chain enoyl-CoA reductase